MRGLALSTLAGATFPIDLSPLAGYKPDVGARPGPRKRAMVPSPGRVKGAGHGDDDIRHQ